MSTPTPRVFYTHQTIKQRVKRRKQPVARAAELTVKQILAWADDFHERTGRWPSSSRDGKIVGSLGEKWRLVDQALRRGDRGLPGGSSLARLLAEHRGVRNLSDPRPLTHEQILEWADSHFRRNGRYPSNGSGPVVDAPGETWAAIDAALSWGRRGLPGGESLARLFVEHRKARDLLHLPPLNHDLIRSWIDAFHKRTGRWPHQKSGPIAEAPGETWSTVDHALCQGRRGLPGGSSLGELVAEHRGVRYFRRLPPFSEKQILSWADEYHRRTGRWPGQQSGPIAGSNGDTWRMVDEALFRGRRGLPGGSSLAQLLAKRRGARNKAALPRLTHKKIVKWAKAFHRLHGRWPSNNSGRISEGIAGVAGETWTGVAMALRNGGRGLPGGRSLAQLLADVRSKR